MIIQTRFSTNRIWLMSLALSMSFALAFMVSVTWLLVRGVGIWGINVPVAWAFAITNFVWWIGIGHAGTFISAILLLCHQEWRTAISRLAETMTIFAVVCAGLFPVLHLGRPWFAYWLFPYYDTMNLWPQFRSPLIWDLFAVSTYLIISVTYWFLGLVPDFAYRRDQCQRLGLKRIYGILALGWRGSQEQWSIYRTTYLLLAGIATPLVIAVHSIVGLDFAAAQVPGWHSTIFPPYFVAGAIFSGFAMVLTLAILLRSALKLQNVLTIRHLDLCAQMALAMSVIVAYGYAIEAFMAAYGDNIFDKGQMWDRYFGPYALVSWLMLTCNVLVPQLLWSKWVRTTPWILFPISLLINVGMWSERFVIVVTSLNHSFMPSSWHIFTPTIWDWLTLFGSIGLFATLYLLFSRVAPVVAITELRETEEFAKAEFR